MKNSQLLFAILGFVLVFGLIGCASTGESSSHNTDDDMGGTSEINVDNPSVTLADYLRRVSGVQVNGNGPSATILVRGSQSFEASTDPLFVLDGIKVGRDFSRISSLVNMTEVKTIRVLKGIEASASYGMQGGNGVIEIYSR